MTVGALAGAASLLLVTGLGLVGPATPAAAQEAGQPTAGSSTASSSSSTASKLDPALLDGLRASGTADFWVRFGEPADLSRARSIDDWADRGAAVVAELQATATAAQAEVRRLLTAQRVAHTPYWATNAIFVTGGSADLAQQLAARAEVTDLLAPTEYQLAEPVPGEPAPAVDQVEWGIANIRADQAWDEFGVRGEDIIVASIDTGAQFDHPALVEQYRGNLGDGTFDHNYHWFDAAGTCPDAPCDQNGHGTHTMGTMVGDDGGDNRIGVAPRATWIAANGCCPDNDALIASGQWLLAPEDLQGENADPARRPHIINNSWGTRVPSNDPIMEDVLVAWEASGILGVWSNGNNGSFGCASSGSPGSRVLNYSVGAYDIDNQIAPFSSRGPGQDGEIKPNIAAPGVAVRSAVPTDSYDVLDGTSMAAPHVTGTAALLLAAAPGLIGDIPGITALLDGTARDTEDLQCGGTAEDNNVFGQGRLDALALLQAAPVGEAGTLAGRVTDAGTGDPVARATVTVAGEGVERDLVTGLDGGYRTRLPAGSYTLTVRAFGYQQQTATDVVVTGGATTARDFDLPPLPAVSLSGRVTDGSGHGWPVYARVAVEGTPVATYTDPFTGRYAVQLPANASYTLTVRPEYPGYGTVTDPIALGAVDRVHDVALAVPEPGCDAAPGYQLRDGTCVPVPGGLVAGLVADANTGTAVTGATVASELDPAARTTTVATPDDRALADGFYWLFSTAPDDQLTVSAYRYPARSAAVSVTPDATTRADVPLPAGRLSVAAEPIEAELPLGGSAERTFTITNTGTAPAELELFELASSFESPVPESPAPTGGEVVRVPTPPEATLTAAGSASPSTRDVPAGSASWQPLPDFPQPLIDNSVVLHDGSQYSFGGPLHTEASAFTYVLAPGQEQWRQLTDANPAPFIQSSAVVIDDRIYLTGGFPAFGGVPFDRNMYIFDPGTESWTTGAELPGDIPAAAGEAALDGQVYLVGGCASSSCNPVLDTVRRYDPASDTWATLARYPEPVAYPTCGGVAGQLICAGGTPAGGRGTDHAYRYDPAADAWSPIAALPFSLWGGAAASVEGQLVVAGGVAGGASEITNEVFRYRPAGDSWGTLPPMGSAAFRHGGGCGLTRVGGGVAPSPGGGWFITETGEILPGLDACDLPAQVPWLAADPAALSIAPGESRTVTVTLDARLDTVDQPGSYTAGIGFTHNTPYPTGWVDVTMTVTRPASWGRLTGTVQARTCAGDLSPVAGATVHIFSWASQRTVQTDDDGRYASWLDQRQGPFFALVAEDGYWPQLRRVKVIAGKTTVLDWTLRPVRPCASVG